ncbi:MAG: carbohydrate ABC transporter permease [Clostridia bacterium]|nr:carbohydrate ABC transporter permease [Clostridia bacterium]
MISKQNKKETDFLSVGYKAYKIAYGVLIPFVIVICICALILSFFTPKEGGNAKIISIVIFSVFLAVAVAAIVLNYFFGKKTGYTQYKPKILTVVNWTTLVAMGAMAIVTIIPFYVLLITSVKTIGEANALTFTWWPLEGFDFSNFSYMFEKMTSDVRINPFTAFLNSMIYALVPSVVGTLVSGLSAYGFSKLYFPGRDKLYRFMLFTIMIPGCIATASSYLFFDSLGWTGIEGISLPLLIPGCFGGMVTIMFIKEYFMGVPDSIFEAAKIDGAGRLQSFIKIALPLAIPAFMAQFIFGVISRYNDYLGPLIYCKYPKQYTLILALQFFDSPGSERQLLAAAGVFGLAPMLILYLIFQNIIINGISVGSGVKG